MVEPVSLSASIISLVGVSAKLSLTFYQLADTIVSSKQEISTLAAEISIFSQCLSMFSRTVDRSISQTERFTEIAVKLVESTRGVLVELAGVVNGIAPLWLSDGPNTTLGFGRRLKWLFQKSKVIALRNNVESYKTTLLTLISVVDYMESRNADAPKIIQNSLHLQAKSLLETSRTAESRCATVEDSFEDGVPLQIESPSRADATLSQDAAVTIGANFDVVTLPDSDSIADPDVEAQLELEGAILTTGELIRTLKLESKSDTKPPPRLSFSELRDLVLAFGAASLATSDSLQYWNWADMRVQNQPKIEQVIYFVDDYKREFTFPLSEVKTWKGMDAMIQQVVNGVPVIGKMVQEGQYTLRNADGRCIVPQLWEVSVKPGTTVTLKTIISRAQEIDFDHYKERFEKHFR